MLACIAVTQTFLLWVVFWWTCCCPFFPGRVKCIWISSSEFSRCHHFWNTLTMANMISVDVFYNKEMSNAFENECGFFFFLHSWVLPLTKQKKQTKKKKKTLLRIFTARVTYETVLIKVSLRYSQGYPSYTSTLCILVSREYANGFRKIRGISLSKKVD